MVNFGDDVLKYLTKCISVKLCPAVTGQTAMECVINPPQEGEPSYQLHQQVSGILKTLLRMQMIFVHFRTVLTKKSLLIVKQGLHMSIDLIF